jgi:CheY-like chemotaxis protein
MNALLIRNADMFGRTRKEIRIIPKLEENLWNVEVDREQMNQVFLNLFVNAWQAMPDGGDLYLQTSNHLVDDNLALHRKILPGRYIKINVTDNGKGIDEKIKPRIFDPFFTTKRMGKGNGLGLASAYGILKNHRGTISVYSEKGCGTTFSIYLPASDKAIEKEPFPVKEEIVKGNELILLIDDETMVIDVGKQMLERLGYRILTAGSGQAALDILRDRQTEIDLVILDMIMPGTKGSELFDQIKEMTPDLRVLLSSGYSLSGQATEILDRGCDGFIQKPFGMKELSQKIKEILGKN